MNLWEKLDPEKILRVLSYDPEAPLLFSSGLFLFIFPLFFGVYLLLGKRTSARLAWTTAFSLYFYYKSSGIFFLLLVLSTLWDYFAGILIENGKSSASKKFWLVASLIYNLGLLSYFKYAGFFLDNLSLIFNKPFGTVDVLLPAGISFFTFQSLSYSIEVYRGKLKAERNLLDFAFFVTFFPQLVAGPIVRAMDFLPQVRAQLWISRTDLSRALLLICGGLFKKVVISDYIAVNFVDRVFDNPGLFSGFEILSGIYGYALQIYCDFSGYSDMAIGIALLMGFRLPDNFNLPYQSSSITEFWRRWHMSLSTWLRDYLYISLGGNRKGKLRTYINLSLTMLLGGLWHGASWKFVVWGGLHGAALAVHKFILDKFRLPTGKAWYVFSIILTFHFVAFCWIFFRAPGFAEATLLIERLFTTFNPAIIADVVSGFKEVFLLMAIGYILHFLPRKLDADLEAVFSKAHWVLQSLFLAFMMWVAIQLMQADVKPFIYFQF